mgnify:CR=1 FL=1
MNPTMLNIKTDKTYYHGLDMSPLKPLDGEEIHHVHFKRAGSKTGRVLFLDWSPMIEITTQNVQIHHCIFE